MKSIVFDVYGTLLDVYSIKALLEKFAPGKGAAMADTWRTKQIDYTRLRTIYGKKKYKIFWEITKDALAYTLSEHRVELSSKEVAILLTEYSRLKPFPETLKSLKYLKKAGYNLSVLSNGNKQMLDEALDSSKISALLDCIISVDDVKLFKVHPSVYSLIGKSKQISEENVVFVSSNHWDIVGAGWSGFETFWINRYNLIPEVLDYVADAEGKNLEALVEFLKRQKKSG